MDINTSKNAKKPTHININIRIPIEDLKTETRSKKIHKIKKVLDLSSHNINKKKKKKHKEGKKCKEILSKSDIIIPRPIKEEICDEELNNGDGDNQNTNNQEETYSYFLQGLNRNEAETCTENNNSYDSGSNGNMNLNKFKDDVCIKGIESEGFNRENVVLISDNGKSMENVGKACNPVISELNNDNLKQGICFSSPINVEIDGNKRFLKKSKKNKKPNKKLSESFLERFNGLDLIDDQGHNLKTIEANVDMFKGGIDTNLNVNCDLTTDENICQNLTVDTFTLTECIKSLLPFNGSQFLKDVSDTVRNNFEKEDEQTENASCKFNEKNDLRDERFQSVNGLLLSTEEFSQNINDYKKIKKKSKKNKLYKTCPEESLNEVDDMDLHGNGEDIEIETLELGENDFRKKHRNKTTKANEENQLDGSGECGENEAGICLKGKHKSKKQGDGIRKLVEEGDEAVEDAIFSVKLQKKQQKDDEEINADETSSKDNRTMQKRIDNVKTNESSEENGDDRVLVENEESVKCTNNLRKMAKSEKHRRKIRESSEEDEKPIQDTVDPPKQSKELIEDDEEDKSTKPHKKKSEQNENMTKISDTIEENESPKKHKRHKKREDKENKETDEKIEIKINESFEENETVIFPQINEVEERESPRKRKKLKKKGEKANEEEPHSVINEENEIKINESFEENETVIFPQINEVEERESPRKRKKQKKKGEKANEEEPHSLINEENEIKINESFEENETAIFPQINEVEETESPRKRKKQKRKGEKANEEEPHSLINEENEIKINESFEASDTTIILHQIIDSVTENESRRRRKELRKKQRKENKGKRNISSESSDDIVQIGKEMIKSYNEENKEIQMKMNESFKKNEEIVYLQRMNEVDVDEENEPQRKRKERKKKKDKKNEEGRSASSEFSDDMFQTQEEDRAKLPKPSQNEEPERKINKSFEEMKKLVHISESDTNDENESRKKCKEDKKKKDKQNKEGKSASSEFSDDIFQPEEEDRGNAPKHSKNKKKNEIKINKSFEEMRKLAHISESDTNDENESRKKCKEGKEKKNKANTKGRNASSEFSDDMFQTQEEDRAKFSKPSQNEETEIKLNKLFGENEDTTKLPQVYEPDMNEESETQRQRKKLMNNDERRSVSLESSEDIFQTEEEIKNVSKPNKNKEKNQIEIKLNDSSILNDKLNVANEGQTNGRSSKPSEIGINESSDTNDESTKPPKKRKRSKGQLNDSHKTIEEEINNEVDRELEDLINGEILNDIENNKKKESYKKNKDIKHVVSSLTDTEDDNDSSKSPRKQKKKKRKLGDSTSNKDQGESLNVYDEKTVENRGLTETKQKNVELSSRESPKIAESTNLISKTNEQTSINNFLQKMQSASSIFDRIKSGNRTRRIRAISDKENVKIPPKPNKNKGVADNSNVLIQKSAITNNLEVEISENRKEVNDIVPEIKKESSTVDNNKNNIQDVQNIEDDLLENLNFDDIVMEIDKEITLENERKKLKKLEKRQESADGEKIMKNSRITSFFGESDSKKNKIDKEKKPKKAKVAKTDPKNKTTLDNFVESTKIANEISKKSSGNDIQANDLDQFDHILDFDKMHKNNTTDLKSTPEAHQQKYSSKAAKRGESLQSTDMSVENSNVSSSLSDHAKKLNKFDDIEDNTRDSKITSFFDESNSKKNKIDKERKPKKAKVAKEDPKNKTTLDNFVESTKKKSSGNDIEANNQEDDLDQFDHILDFAKSFADFAENFDNIHRNNTTVLKDTHEAHQKKYSSKSAKRGESPQSTDMSDENSNVSSSISDYAKKLNNFDDIDVNTRDDNLNDSIKIVENVSYNSEDDVSKPVLNGTNEIKTTASPKAKLIVNKDGKIAIVRTNADEIHRTFKEIEEQVNGASESLVEIIKSPKTSKMQKISDKRRMSTLVNEKKSPKVNRRRKSNQDAIDSPKTVEEAIEIDEMNIKIEEIADLADENDVQIYENEMITTASKGPAESPDISKMVKQKEKSTEMSGQLEINEDTKKEISKKTKNAKRTEKEAELSDREAKVGRIVKKTKLRNDELNDISKNSEQSWFKEIDSTPLNTNSSCNGINNIDDIGEETNDETNSANLKQITVNETQPDKSISDELSKIAENKIKVAKRKPVKKDKIEEEKTFKSKEYLSSTDSSSDEDTGNDSQPKIDDLEKEIPLHKIPLKFTVKKLKKKPRARLFSGSSDTMSLNDWNLKYANSYQDTSLNTDRSPETDSLDEVSEICNKDGTNGANSKFTVDTVYSDTDNENLVIDAKKSKKQNVEIKTSKSTKLKDESPKSKTPTFKKSKLQSFLDNLKETNPDDSDDNEENVELPPKIMARNKKVISENRTKSLKSKNVVPKFKTSGKKSAVQVFLDRFNKENPDDHENNIEQSPKSTTKNKKVIGKNKTPKNRKSKDENVASTSKVSRTSSEKRKSTIETPKEDQQQTILKYFDRVLTDRYNCDTSTRSNAKTVSSLSEFETDMNSDSDEVEEKVTVKAKQMMLNIISMEDEAILKIMETNEQLRHLEINIDWDVPLIHRIETRVTSVPTRKQVAAFKDLNIKVKTGPFTKTEDDTIKSNFQQFCKAHNLDDDPLPFMKFRYNGTDLIKTQERINFVRYLGKSINDRKLWRIYHRFKVIYGGFRVGRFTEEEDLVIENYMKIMNDDPRKYLSLSKILKRPRLAIEKHAMQLKLQRDANRLRHRHHGEIVKSIMKIMDVKTCEELKSKQISDKDWTKISKATNINKDKLTVFWDASLQTKVFHDGPIKVDEILRKFLDILDENEESDFRNLNWNKLAKSFENITRGFLYRLFKRSLFYVPEEKRPHLRRCVIHLKEIYKEKGKLFDDIPNIVLEKL